MSLKTHKAFFLCFFVLVGQTIIAQENTVKSLVYNWTDLKVEKLETYDRRQVIDGSTTDLEALEIHTSTLAPSKAPHPGHKHVDNEELIIVKEGKVKVTIQGVNKVLGPGSVAYILPNDEHAIENAINTPSTYYILKFKARTPIDMNRGTQAGGSFTIDWNDVKFVAGEKGGRRQIFDRATAMFKRFEMHVTTLNKGLVSHAPHTHRAEEIIVLVSGDAEMQIGETKSKAAPGAVVFLGSQVLHNLGNVGDGPCEYFAFQWQLAD